MAIRRIGCVGDLHGALGSLLTVLEHLRNAEVEGILFTGDFARGPFNRDPALGNTASPEELMSVVTSASANVLLVPGNHDDPALGGSVSVDGRETSWLGWRVAGIGGSPYTGGRFPYEWRDDRTDLDAFRTFQKQPEWRGRPVDQQMRRLLGSSVGKIKYAPIFVEALDLDRIPEPLDAVLAHVR